MSERLVVSKTMEPHTIASLTKDFKQIGVEETDTILVHTSLASLGWVVGGEQALIEALISAVSRGNLVMATHTGQNSDPKDWTSPTVPKEWFNTIYDHMPAFDVTKTPTSRMGAVPELFRHWPGVIRSNHPQVSFAAFGKDAAAITKDHPLTPQMGEDSPLGKLYQMNAKVLLIGVFYDVASALHLSEVKWGKLPTVGMGAAMAGEESEKQWRWFDDYDYDANDFSAIGRAYEADHKDRVQLHSIGLGNVRLIDMANLVDFGKQWMDDHR